MKKWFLYTFLTVLLLGQVVVLFGISVVYNEVQSMKAGQNVVHEYQYKQIANNKVVNY